MAERLFDDHAREGAAALRVGDHLLGAEELGDDGEEIRRHGQVVDAAAAGAARFVALLQALVQLEVGLGFVEVAADVEESLGEVLPHRLVDRPRAREFVASLAHGHAPGVVGEVGPGEADDGLPRRQEPVVRERVERRHELALRQVARRSEDHEAGSVGDALLLEALAKGVGFDDRRCGHSHAAIVSED